MVSPADSSMQGISRVGMAERSVNEVSGGVGWGGGCVEPNAWTKINMADILG